MTRRCSKPLSLAPLPLTLSPRTPHTKPPHLHFLCFLFLFDPANMLSKAASFVSSFLLRTTTMKMARHLRHPPHRALLERGVRATTTTTMRNNEHHERNVNRVLVNVQQTRARELLRVRRASVDMSAIAASPASEPTLCVESAASTFTVAACSPKHTRTMKHWGTLVRCVETRSRTSRLLLRSPTTTRKNRRCACSSTVSQRVPRPN